jgi:hypothetical protein
MKKNTHTSEAVDHRQCNGQMKNEKEHWYIRSCKSQTMHIALSVIYSFWCISVLFHFSFDHCIGCDLQILMYHCSFSFFIWPLHCLWSTASDVWVFFFIFHLTIEKNTYTSKAVNHRQCNGQMKNEKEHWYIKNCKS